MFVALVSTGRVKYIIPTDCIYFFGHFVQALVGQDFNFFSGVFYF